MSGFWRGNVIKNEVGTIIKNVMLLETIETPSARIL